MVRCLGMTDRIRPGRILAGAALAPPGAAAPARAPDAAAGPPPKKVAAGACVTACPGGYEDPGRVCLYRDMSR